MNPKDIITDEWLDGEPIPDDKNSGKGKSFAHHVVYADGTEEYIYFRYGNDQPAKTERLTNADQQKIWQAQQAKQPTPQDPDVDEAAKRNNREAQILEDERVANKAAGGDYETNIQRAGRERQAKLDEDASATRASAEARATAADARAANSGGSIMERPDGVYIVKPDGTSIKTNLPAKPSPGTNQIVKGDDGTTYVVSIDAEGKVSTQVAIPSSTGVDEPPGAPPLDLTPGNGMQGLVTYKSWLSGQAGLSQAQRTALLTDRIKLVKAAAEESAGVAGISAGIMGEQGAEARSERAQANTRLSESQGTYRGALDYIMQTSKFQGRNGPKASSVMDEILGRAKSFAQEMGGTVNTPRNPVPTQLAPYYSVPGQAPAGGMAPGAAPSMPAAPAPAPAAPPVMPAAPAPAPAGPQPLYAPPASMQAGPAPGPTADMPVQQPGGQFAEMVEIMRRAGLDPAAIDLANNISIANMLGGGW